MYDGGYYQDMPRGIGLGCPLSPLMGALYLKQLDKRIAETGLFYCRFMDDWVILAPTRWKLRAAIRIVNETLAELKVEKHPDKTCIGRIARGFDFLGYTFSSAGLGIAPQTLGRCVERITQLYEQRADSVRMGVYVRHWWRWVRAGVTVMPEALAAAGHHVMAVLEGDAGEATRRTGIGQSGCGTGGAGEWEGC